MLTEEMPSRGKLFTMRQSEEEAAQAEAVAQLYGMTTAGLVRMLIAREAAEMGRGGDTTSDPFDTKDEDRGKALLMILRAIKSEGSGSDPASVDEIVRWLHGAGFDNRWRGWKGFPAMLNALRRPGYIVKRLGGYVLTLKGDEFVKSNRGRY